MHQHTHIHTSTHDMPATPSPITTPHSHTYTPLTTAHIHHLTCQCLHSFRMCGASVPPILTETHLTLCLSCPPPYACGRSLSRTRHDGTSVHLYLYCEQTAWAGWRRHGGTVDVLAHSSTDALSRFVAPPRLAHGLVTMLHRPAPLARRDGWLMVLRMALTCAWLSLVTADSPAGRAEPLLG